MPGWTMSRWNVFCALRFYGCNCNDAPATGAVEEVVLRADYGDRVSLKGRLQRPHPARNPGAFDYRSFLAQRDIDGTLLVGKGQQGGAVEHLPGHWSPRGGVVAPEARGAPDGRAQSRGCFCRAIAGVVAGGEAALFPRRCAMPFAARGWRMR